MIALALSVSMSELLLTFGIGRSMYSVVGILALALSFLSGV